MAAYASTTTLDFPNAMRLGNRPFGIMSGTVNLTNYNATLVAITAITGQFLSGGKLRVSGGVSSNGYPVKWDSTGKAFRAYATGSAEHAALDEVASDVNVGTFDFIAVGQLGL